MQDKAKSFSVSFYIFDAQKGLIYIDSKSRWFWATTRPKSCSEFPFPQGCWTHGSSTFPWAPYAQCHISLFLDSFLFWMRSIKITLLGRHRPCILKAQNYRYCTKLRSRSDLCTICLNILARHRNFLLSDIGSCDPAS